MKIQKAATYHRRGDRQPAKAQEASSLKMADQGAQEIQRRRAIRETFHDAHARTIRGRK